MARKPALPDPPQPAPASAFAALAALRGSLPAGPGPEPATADQASPFGKRIVVMRERKGRAGKTVTVVRGIELTGQALDALAREMRQALGTGGGIEDGAIVLNGDLSARASEWLTARGAQRVVSGN